MAVMARYLYAVTEIFDFRIKEEFNYIRLSVVYCDRIENNRLLDAVLLVEDKRFFTHKGIDLRGIIRAFSRILFFGRLEGGSTIEQQYVRLITNRREISLKRKLRECILAAKLSYSFSKLQILNSYLQNYPFFGEIKGLSELAVFEGFIIGDLTKEQIACLVARLKYPFASKGNPLYLRRVSMIMSLIGTHPEFKHGLWN